MAELVDPDALMATICERMTESAKRRLLATALMYADVGLPDVDVKRGITASLRPNLNVQQGTSLAAAIVGGSPASKT